MINKNETKRKITNWKEYNESLKRRGSIDIWIDSKIEKTWRARKTGKRGAPKIYSDLTIQTVLTLGKVFSQRLRQTEGMVESIFRMMELELPVPDYTTMSKRGEGLIIELPQQDKEKVRILIDSTGLKVYGEGEWKVRKHGVGKRRTWKKLHIGIDEDNEIRMVKLTGNNVDDAETALDMIDEEESEIESLKADGAYDKRKIYDKCKDLVKNVVIPPQKNAKIWRHGNTKGKRHARDENLREIRKKGRKVWKEESGYHKRSLAETAMYRYKMMFSDKLNAREDGQQETEINIVCAALNLMTDLGMPKYELIVN